MKTVRQTATIRGATPHDIDEILIDSKKHTKLSPRADKGPPHRPDLAREQLGEGPLLEGHVPFGKGGRGTRVTFTQSGVPDDKYAETSAGWRRYYWTPPRAQFASKIR